MEVRSAVTSSICAPDNDDDNVPDDVDNCIEHANTEQLDTDGDRFGNRCDADFNNDNIVNALDLGKFRADFLGNDPDSDLNGDGTVNALDLGQMRDLFLKAPGPSALRE